MEVEELTINTKAQPRPFLKWVGGKSRLIPQISKFYPDNYNVYFEPFVGGGALFFSINPSSAHINDTNKVLIFTFKTIRDEPAKLIKYLKAIQQEYWDLDTLELKKQYFLDKRAEFNSLNTAMFERVCLLIFLNKTCFNGMYRENSKGEYNVPFGRHFKPTICDEKNILAVSNALQKTKITSQSYEKAIVNAKKGDFVYFDPPYHPINETSSFTSYQADGFNKADQIKLRDIFVKLSERGCKVMLSNSDTELINELYKEFNIHKIYAARSINANGQKRGKIAEVLVTSY